MKCTFQSLTNLKRPPPHTHTHTHTHTQHARATSATLTTKTTATEHVSRQLVWESERCHKLTRAGARDAFASKKDHTSVSGQINATWNYVWLGEFGEVFSAICYIGFPIVFFWLLPCNFSYNHGSLNLEVYDISWYLVISRYVHISLRLKTIHGIQKVNFLQGWQNTWGDHQS